MPPLELNDVSKKTFELKLKTLSSYNIQKILFSKPIKNPDSVIIDTFFEHNGLVFHLFNMYYDKDFYGVKNDIQNILKQIEEDIDEQINEIEHNTLEYSVIQGIPISFFNLIESYSLPLFYDKYGDFVAAQFIKLNYNNEPIDIINNIIIKYLKENT